MAIPKPVLVGAAVLIGIVLLLAAVAGRTGTGRVVSEADTMRPVASRWLEFRDRPDGSVTVTDARTGRALHTIPGESNFFTRGVMRSLVRQRDKRGLPAGGSFQLVLWSSGQLTIADTATDTRVDLTAFGPTNRDAFLRFLERPGDDAGDGERGREQASTGG